MQSDDENHLHTVSEYLPNFLLLQPTSIMSSFDRHSLLRRGLEPTTIRLKDKHGNDHSNGAAAPSTACCIYFFNTILFLEMEEKFTNVYLTIGQTLYGNEK